MDEESIKNTINSVNWWQYCGPKYYEPESVSPALLSLLNITESSKANSVGDRVLFALGNNHAGTYYPAILSALDIIIDIEALGNNQVRKKCAGAILSDLSSFEPEPELGEFNGCSLGELLQFADGKLAYYGE